MQFLGGVCSPFRGAGASPALTCRTSRRGAPGPGSGCGCPGAPRTAGSARPSPTARTRTRTRPRSRTRPKTRTATSAPTEGSGVEQGIKASQARHFSWLGGGCCTARDTFQLGLQGGACMLTVAGRGRRQACKAGARMAGLGLRRTGGLMAFVSQRVAHPGAAQGISIPETIIELDCSLLLL